MNKVYAVVICLLVGAQAACGQSLALPDALVVPARAVEQRLQLDLADGRLDEHTILEAALLAGGADDAVVVACSMRINTLVAAWRETGAIQGTPAEQAERLFDLMHRELLSAGYRHDANDLGQTILHGWYNCVSATLLWQHLAAEFEIPAVARQLPGHVQSVLALDEGRRIVELTSPYWLSAHPQPSAEGRDLDDAALIASVYYNRGLQLLTERQFAAALSVAYTAHCLDPASVAARGNVLAMLNNWALDLAAHGQFDRALKLLEQGREIAPEHQSFQTNLTVLRSRLSDASLVEP